VSEKGSKTSGICWTVVLRGVTRGTSRSCVSQFEIKDQAENARRGDLDSFVLFGSRGSDSKRKNSGRKQKWAVNGDAVRLLSLEIRRKLDQQRRRKGVVYVQGPFGKWQGASPRDAEPNGLTKVESRLPAGFESTHGATMIVLTLALVSEFNFCCRRYCHQYGGEIQPGQQLRAWPASRP